MPLQAAKATLTEVSLGRKSPVDESYSMVMVSVSEISVQSERVTVGICSTLIMMTDDG